MINEKDKDKDKDKINDKVISGCFKYIDTCIKEIFHNGIKKGFSSHLILMTMKELLTQIDIFRIVENVLEKQK